MLTLGRLEAGLRTWIDATLAAHAGSGAGAAPPGDRRGEERGSG